MKRYTASDFYKNPMTMRNIRTSLTLMMLAAVAAAGAQSGDYSSLEKRFVKSELTADDTAAFRRAGEQKVRQLFEKGSFYSENRSNPTNQAFVKQQIPDLLYAAPGETPDVDGLLGEIEKAKRNQPQSLELKTLPAEGYLGVTETVNYDPKFRFYLVLMQIPKQFGKEEEMVWQVLLRLPENEEVKTKKFSKSSGDK